MLRARMLSLLDSLDEAKFASTQRSVKLPKHGLPVHQLKTFQRTGQEQKTMLRVARRAKDMGRPDAAALAVTKAKDLGREQADVRTGSQRRQKAKTREERRMKIRKLLRLKK